eukprot:TRINITY_DN3113_c0_g1_i2.p1 TRINITY_DN3113_c0_g1~~TRINITY_DN3113_c0_g1_i2.p1  ORF type:complete len:356 (+),score=82.90 TRINITY_DN3113_c0_g1_i2:94-1068(+)
MAAPGSASGNSGGQSAMQGAPAASSSAQRRLLRRAVAEIFDNVAVVNVDKSGLQTNEAQRTFNCQEVPDVDVGAYVSQITGSDTRSERSWLYALIIADHFCRKAKVVLSPHSVHRIAVCSLLMALKVTCDTACVNGAVARIAGVRLEDLNQMERVWLTSVGFNLTIYPDYYMAVAQHLGSILKHSRNRRSRGNRADRNLIPDEIRNCFPRGVLHDYQQGKSPPEPGEALRVVLPPSSPPSGGGVSPASPAPEHPLYSWAAGTPKELLPSSAAATAPPTLAEKPRGGVQNGACSQAAVGAMSSPTTVAPSPPSGPRPLGRPRRTT